MKNPMIIYIILILQCAILLTDCKKDDKKDNQCKYCTWDVDNKTLPQFVGVNYIELNKIIAISKFRSGEGHDYSDGSEHCRSMKHYFHPIDTLDWSKIKIVSPVTGTITRLYDEWAGTQIEVQSDDYPAFRFMIFHVTVSPPRNLNDKVSAGEQLGTHIGNQTWSDISVWVNDPAQQGRLVSWFQVMTDELFNTYKNRGIASRDDMIISKTLRDANPLVCSDETFISTDTLKNWVTMSAPLK
jgi:hypothetical protein